MHFLSLLEPIVEAQQSPQVLLACKDSNKGK